MAQQSEGEGRQKSEILDASVVIEGHSGLTTIFGIIEYPPALGNCTVLWPEKEDFYLALDTASRLRLIGKPIGAIDIMVASMCINRNMKLITKDNDFVKIKEVEKSFKAEILR